MMTDVTQVQVFKTNVNTPEEKLRVLELLRNNALVEDVSIDLEDVDKVLRIVTSQIDPNQIMNTLSSFGFMCQELD